MNQTLFMPETFPHRSWAPAEPQGWLDKLESLLDWLMGLDEE